MDVEEADIAAGNVDRDSDGGDRLGRCNQRDDDDTAESESEPAEEEWCGGEHEDGVSLSSSRLDNHQESESEYDGCDDVDPCREPGEGPQERDTGDLDGLDDHSEAGSRASQDDLDKGHVETGYDDGGNEIDAGVRQEENLGDEIAGYAYHSQESDCNEAEPEAIDESPLRTGDSQYRRVDETDEPETIDKNSLRTTGDSQHRVDETPSAWGGEFDDHLRTDNDETAPLVQRPKTNSDRRRSSAVNSIESSHVSSIYVSDHFSDEDEMERGSPSSAARVRHAKQEDDNDSGPFDVETPKERRIKYAKAAVLITVVWVVMIAGVSIILSIDIWGVSDRFDRTDDEDLCILCGNHTLDFDFNSTSSDYIWPSLPTSNTATVVSRTLKPPPDDLSMLCSPTIFLGTGLGIESCVQKCLPAACCLFHDKQAVLELVGTLGLTGDLEQQAYLYLSNVKDCSNEVDTCQAYSAWCASLYGGLDQVLETSLPAYFERNCDKDPGSMALSKSLSSVDGCAQSCLSVGCCYQEHDTGVIATAVMRKRTRQHAGGMRVLRRLQGRQQCDHINTNDDRTMRICDAYSPYCDLEEPSVDPSQSPSTLPSFVPTGLPSSPPSASSLPSPQPSSMPSSSQQPTSSTTLNTTISNDASMRSPIPSSQSSDAPSGAPSNETSQSYSPTSLNSTSTFITTTKPAMEPSMEPSSRDANSSAPSLAFTTSLGPTSANSSSLSTSPPPYESENIPSTPLDEVP